MSTDPDKYRILVVDDSRLMRRAISKILKGHDIIEAEDGEDGWNKLVSDNEIQVVISDLSMPNLDGFGLMDIIRNYDKDERIKQIPIIIITGAEDDDVVKQQALDHGATDFITKPFDSFQLNARIKAHSESIRQQRELQEKSAQLEQQTTIDTVSGLYNQKYFVEQGQRDLAFAKRHRGELSLLRINLDRFDTVFLKHGKETANQILTQVGDILRNNIRTEDSASRIGVAKFCVILPSANLIGCAQIAERIRHEIAGTEFNTAEGNIKLTASFGVASPPIDNSTEFNAIYEIAEARVTQAQESGGDCITTKDEKGEEEVPAAASLPAPTVEQALKLLESQQQDELEPHLPELLHKVAPLLKLCQEKITDELAAVLAKIRGSTD
jgi:diguanylate cyclase (GGDEF)-like protein